MNPAIRLPRQRPFVQQPHSVSWQPALELFTDVVFTPLSGMNDEAICWQRLRNPPLLDCQSAHLEKTLRVSGFLVSFCRQWSLPAAPRGKLSAGLRADDSYRVEL